MFSNLAKFEIQRSGKQAFGFYISYLVLGILLGFVAGGIGGLLDPDHAQQAGFRAGNVSAIIMCCALAITIASKKSLLSSFKNILIIVITAALSLLFGAIGGLIPVAYLTTAPKENE
jgi:hypothetical protein